MSLLRSETQIFDDLRIIAHAQLAGHSGNPSSLIHSTKELVSLRIDRKLSSSSLLASRYNIHGAEIGLSSNDIFSGFQPLGSVIGKYAKTFGLFKMIEAPGRTEIVPLLKKAPDISDIVSDAEEFSKEAAMLGSLPFAGKNILATHRNMGMTMEAHRAVARLLLRYCGNLPLSIKYRDTMEINFLVDKINECAVELVKKSHDYPNQAPILKNTLLGNDSPIAKMLGNQIQPHAEKLERAALISYAVLRGTHLLRSILNKAGLYARDSEPLQSAIDRFIPACRKADLRIPLREQLTSVLVVLNFLTESINHYFLWWESGYGQMAT